MSNLVLASIIKGMMVDKMPCQTILERGLGLAWTPADDNGRCCLALSRQHKWERGRWVAVEPSAHEVKIIHNILYLQLSPQVYNSLKQEAPQVVDVKRNGQTRKYTVIRLYWYAIEQGSLL